MKKKVPLALIVFGLIIIVGAAAVYFTYIYTKSCGNNYACFLAHLEKCEKAKVIYETQDTSWFYRIQGKEKNNCIVEVQLLQVKAGKLDIEKLQGDAMQCVLPLGVVQAPEKDISRCHGMLKEGLQEIIIQRLHNYILGNLKSIGTVLEKSSEFVPAATESAPAPKNITGTNTTNTSA